MKLTDNLVCKLSDSQQVSLELNTENRHRLVNALTIFSLQISWMQSTVANPVATTLCYYWQEVGRGLETARLEVDF